MPRIAGVATVVPPYRVGQDEARKFARTVFSAHRRDIERLLPVFDHAGIDARYFSKPLEWFAETHPLEEKNDFYIESATALGEKAARDVLRQAGLAADRIDYIIYVNTTGLATPSSTGWACAAISAAPRSGGWAVRAGRPDWPMRIITRWGTRISEFCWWRRNCAV